MRWLLLGLLISLGVLLLAVAGLARHVLVKRKELSSRPVESADPAPDHAAEHEETDVEQ